MNEMYAPPKADVSVDPTSEGAMFYVVAPRKFFLMSVITLNLYLIYWSYRNWRNFKISTGQSMWPPMRGLFLIFFTHSLFSRVDTKLKSQQATFEWSASGTATLVVILIIAANVLNRLSFESIGSPITDVLSVLLGLAIPAAALVGQRAINLACGDPEGATNAGITGANWVWIIIGGILWILTLMGLYVIIFAPELLVE